ncbi:MAG: trimeric intracellular cation channel family protein [Bacteroidetes bacterium]|nr:trimeric intracellular cation channel family protein [Bacteroidota bacterium]MBS1608856.1 trimeric intracellular cation channel family protein [Bacteroidota bacterium]
MTFTDLLLYAGTFVFAITGALKARAHKMDILGGSVLAFATAYGGGTVRDLLIGIRVGWMNDNIPLLLVITAVIVVFLFKNNIHAFEKTIFFTDAVGLGLFTAGGIERSLAHGISEPYSIVLGVMSATFGGLIADLLSGRQPSLLQKGELYATASAAGGVVYLILKHLHIGNNICLAVCVAFVVLIRIISRKQKIELPHI